MAIPRSMGWLVVTGVVLLLLVGLSLFALDRPNVVWVDGKPWCPECRSEVARFSHRCRECREEFDWTPSPDDDSPLCVHCLTPLEDDAARERRIALGDDKAAAAAAEALALPEAVASEFLKAMGPGQCGWCGGTGRDLSAPAGETRRCPVCFGDRRCVACGGDRRVRLGVEAAAIALRGYLALVSSAETDGTPPVAARRELEKAAETFLLRHAGTREASSLVFWPRFRDPEAPRRGTAAEQARTRLERVLASLGRTPR